MRLGWIAALLALGIITGVLVPGRLTTLFGDLTLNVFLPALIFEAAWSLDFQLVRRKWLPIALLALPGVAITAAVIAAGAHFAGRLAWPPALVLGAILSATDPVAVVAIFRSLNVPPALATIVESEALLNDALAVVLYRTVIAAVVVSAGTLAGGLHVAALAASGVLVAVAIGIAFAVVAAFALRDAVGTLWQCLATFACAYGCYALCERFGWSGIFAVVTFGIVLRELERRRLSVTAAEGVSGFWSMLAIAANFALFFLIGAAIDFSRVPHFFAIAAVTLVSVLLARVLVAYGLLSLARQYLKPFWMTVVRMAGIRGALSLALAISIPAQLIQRPLVVDAVFVVVVVTIFVGAVTLSPRMRRMDLEGG